MCLFGQMEMWGALREAPTKMYYPTEMVWVEEAGIKDSSLREAHIAGWLQTKSELMPEWTPQFLKS